MGGSQPAQCRPKSRILALRPVVYYQLVGLRGEPIDVVYGMRVGMALRFRGGV